MQNRIVEIATDLVHLSVDRGFLKVSKDKKTLGKVALDDIAGLVIRGYGTSFSANICVRLAENNAPIIICGSNQAPACVIWPIEGHHQQGLHMQAQAVAKKPLLKRLWADLIKCKIQNQSAILNAHLKNSDDLTAMAKRVRSGDPDNLEAQAARRYWSRLMGKGFKRDRQEEGLNAALNYGYIVLRAAAARSILAAGLHPSLSIQHQSRGDALRLADDLMEPFRPFVDHTVLQCANNLEKSQTLELTKETKTELVKVLSLDLQSVHGASPLQLCLDRLAQSLVDVYMGEKTKLELPTAPMPLSIAKQKQTTNEQ